MVLEQVVANLVQKVEHRFYGKYRGFVVDNQDPQHLGRLKLRVPSVLGNQVVTGWAMPCLPYGGDANQGFLFIPQVSAGVWVEFEEGDLEFPIWVGTFWSKPGGESELPKPNDPPDGAEQDSVQHPPTRKIIKTVKGHTIQLEDKDGEEMIIVSQVIDADKRNTVTMNKEGLKITSQNKDTDKAKQHVITMDKEGIMITDVADPSNEVILNSKGITISDAHQNKVTLSDSGITIVHKNADEATIKDGAITLKSNSVTIDATSIMLGGSGASEPFVKGTAFQTEITKLVTMLNTHTHVGNMGAPTGPPTPPIQPFSPVLSTTIKGQ